MHCFSPRPSVAREPPGRCGAWLHSAAGLPLVVLERRLQARELAVDLVLPRVAGVEGLPQVVAEGRDLHEHAERVSIP